MKKFYHFLFLIIIGYNSQGQETWVANTNGSWSEPGILIEETCGDTLFEGKIYEKLYASNFESTSLTGGRRIQGDTVFLLDFSSGIERILYDYSMQVGDQIQLSTGDYIVTDVSLGTKKQITLKNTLFGDEDIWLQGIGSIVSSYTVPGNYVNVFDFDIEFNCYHNGTTGEQYGGPCILNPDQYFCQTTALNAIYENQEISIYPNPAIENINIDLSDSKILTPECIIYNSSGKRVESMDLDNTINKMSTVDLIPGLYLIEIRGNEHRSLHRMLIN